MAEPAASQSSAAKAPAGGFRTPWWLLGLALVAGAVYLMATADTGPADPTDATVPQSHTTVVFNSAIIVFREGLEAVLIFAAITASFRGANRARRRPVVLGAASAFGFAVVTWFIVQAVLDAASSLGPKLEAITGFIAVVVLLLILNWFVHKVYWTSWIGKHHRQRRKLLASSGIGATAGLVALGFTSVYREGFEVVLFLQNLKLKEGGGPVIEGLLLGLAATAVVGVVTFVLHAKLPYKRMLIVTGGMVGVVLVVMIGGTALSFQELGWIPRHDLPFDVPGWMGSWFEVYGTYETVGTQILAGAFVIGSYYLAEYLKVTRPTRRGRVPHAMRATEAPAHEATAADAGEDAPAFAGLVR
ncbi:MAG: iron permease [Solirubrobacterales bacterium]|jgi:high-affinity iron transporter|nr:iron permease [Solirubrobacterales bacterium]